MTYWILLAIAGGVTLFALKFRNLMFAFAAAISWIGVWSYSNRNPPAGITVGDFNSIILLFTFIMMAIGVFFIYLRNRSRGYTGFPLSKTEQKSIDDKQLQSRARRSIMQLNENEYKMIARNAVRRGRGR